MTSKDKDREALWQHVGGKESDKEQAKVANDLIKLADELSQILMLVHPRPKFVKNLKSDLLSHTANDRIIVAQPRRRGLMVGALLSGSILSALGIFLLIRVRRGKRSSLASSLVQ